MSDTTKNDEIKELPPAPVIKNVEVKNKIPVERKKTTKKVNKTVVEEKSFIKKPNVENYETFFLIGACVFAISSIAYVLKSKNILPNLTKSKPEPSKPLEVSQEVFTEKLKELKTPVKKSPKPLSILPDGYKFS